MRKRILGAAGSLLVLILASCQSAFSPWDEGVIFPPPDPISSAPESLLVNLEVAYRRHDIERYARLLAPEFIFKGQATDVLDLGLENDFLTRNQDSTGTANLFRTNQVSAIRIELIYGAAVPTSDLSFPPGTMKILVDRVDLEVDQTDGITWIVTDQQEFYFRKGLASASEDTTRWFILEWHELSAQAESLGSHDGGATPMVRSISWGGLKTLYR